jgi:hypothetical protein
MDRVEQFTIAKPKLAAGKKDRHQPFLTALRFP